MNDIIRVRIEDYEDGISDDAWTLKSEKEYSAYIAWDYTPERQWWVEDAPEMHKREPLLTAKSDTRRHRNMNINEIYTSNWLRAADLQGREVKVRIEDWDVTEFKQTDGTVKKQIALKFFGKEKRLGLNKTNSGMIAGMYGEDTEGWIGKEVTIYPTKDRGPNGMIDCIRVRFVDPRSANGKPKTAVKAPVDELNPPDDMNDEVPF